MTCHKQNQVKQLGRMSLEKASHFAREYWAKRQVKAQYGDIYAAERRIEILGLNQTVDGNMKL